MFDTVPLTLEKYLPLDEELTVFMAISVNLYETYQLQLNCFYQSIVVIRLQKT